MKGSAPALPHTEDFAHISTLPRGTGGGLHVSEAVLGKLV